MKQSVFLKCKIMLCSRMMKCRRWSPQPAASAASAAANPGGCVALGCCRWSQPASCPPQALWLPSPGAIAVDLQNNYNNNSNNRNNSQ
jgi:hypothetical protein